MPLAQLPSATVNLIGSSQVITSVSSVVKELMENSIDSGAQQIEIKLEKHGLEKIEVKDDGCGIGKNDVTVMCLKSYTSKISNFCDLDSLSSYGFRGEALSSLCAVANINVTTKTSQDDVATCYTFDQKGQVICSKTSHIVKGTIVTVTELFKNLPVRKQFMSNSKKAGEELKKIEKLVKSLAVVHPRLRVSLIHNRFLCWQKTSVTNLRQSIMQVVSLSIAKQLHHILHNTEQICVEMLVPKSDCNIASLCLSNFSDAHFLFINQRPIRDKEVEKIVYNKINEYFGVYIPVNKYPLCVTCLKVPPDSLDVNLEPNKTRVYLKDQENILDIVKQCLHLYYGNSQKEEKEDDAMIPTKRRKKESEQEIHSKIVEPINHNNEKAEGEEDNVSSNLITINLDSTFENYCLEREKSINGCGELVGKDIECGEKKVTANSISSNHSDVENIQTNLHCLKPLNNNGSNHTEVESNMQNLDVVEDSDKHSKNIAKSEKFDEHSALTHTNNYAELVNQDIKIIDVPNEYSTELPKIEMKVDCVNSEDSDDDEMTLVFGEEGHSAASDSGRGSQEELTPTLSQWSRGDVKISSGSPIKGPCVLTNALKPSRSSKPPDKNIFCLSPQITERSVTSQMGCKEMSAFTKFAKNMRKQILDKNPQMSFTRVAQKLQEKWRELEIDEKKKYEKCDLLKNGVSPAPVHKQQTLTKMITRNTPNIELDINLNILEQIVKCPKRLEEEPACLIGQLEASPLWLYRSNDSSITVFSVPRLTEAVKFHQHLGSYKVPPKILEKYIPISPSDIGDVQWRLLFSLERSSNGIVKDQRILNNGFVVEIGEGDAQLTYVPKQISYCGVNELKEVLQLMQTYGPAATLDQCRPLCVISFLRNEVMRECSAQESPVEGEQVNELLSYWLSNVIHHTKFCIHHTPVSQSLHIV